MITEVVFDIETKKIFDDIETNNPADLGISIVSAYRRQLDDGLNEINGEMKSFWEEDFSQMWSFFENTDRIIGFNSLHFDVPAMAPLAPYDFKKMAHFDIMEHIKNFLGHRLSLNAIASQTIGHTKIDHGLNAVYYWQEHTPESLAKLKKYCEADVIVTKEVYDFALKNKYLKYMDKWNTIRQIDVDFSHPPQSSAPPQLGLF
ncbi:MAG TPA: ribonuclease H-like domain-containing protein [Candidatus Woesebacteria bacterium]|nr:ribonuclease H-like domain-containing protein [Candidatus Woesebacteria bacterium]HPJ16699.1 ribonuclease H-like domain-containing protein [Candidatus Woesebacteria bacterium]